VISDFWHAGLIWDLVFKTKLGGKNYSLFSKTFLFVVNTTALIYLPKYSDKN